MEMDYLRRIKVLLEIMMVNIMHIQDQFDPTENERLAKLILKIDEAIGDAESHVTRKLNERII